MKKIIYCFLFFGFLVGCYYDKSVSTPSANITPILTDSFVLTYSPTSSTINAGIAGTSLKPTIINTIGGGVTYTLVLSPVGVSIDASGIISWTNKVTVGTYNLSVTATNANGVTSNTAYSLFVNAAGTPVSAPSGFSYSPAAASIVTGTAGTSKAPAINTGGANVTYIDSTLPVGVTINALTGVLSWGTTVAIGTYTITVTAKNSVGKITTTYVLTVTASVTPVEYQVSFKNDILPVIITKCTSCHHNNHTTWISYAAIAATGSGILNKLSPVGNMPQGSSLALVPTTKVSTGLYRDLYKLWISQGSLNN